MKYDVVDELFRNVAKASAKLGVKFVLVNKLFIG